MAQKKTEIIVKSWVKSHVQRCRGLALVRVRNGKGLLYHRRILEPSDSPQEYSTKNERIQSVLYGERLLSAEIEDYQLFESIFRRGTGRGHQDREAFRKAAPGLNGAFVSLKQSVRDIAPILELLESGDYLVGDYLLPPLYGSSDCFWDQPPYYKRCNRSGMLQNQCYYEFAGYGMSYHGPFGLMATEAPSFLDPERVTHYREQMCLGAEPRALALFVSGGLALLLDGHQKAMAAFELGKLLPCLVIMKLSTKTSDDYETKLSSDSRLCYQQWTPLGPGPSNTNYLSDSQGNPIASLESPEEMKPVNDVSWFSKKNSFYWEQSDGKYLPEPKRLAELCRQYSLKALDYLELIPLNQLREIFEQLPGVQFLVDNGMRTCVYLNKDCTEMEDVNDIDRCDSICFALRQYLELEPDTKWFQEAEKQRIREIANARENYDLYMSEVLTRRIKRMRKLIFGESR